MLVLTRRVEQKLQIGPNITVTVLRIRGRAVKIGVEAPQGVPVLRAELLGRSCPGEVPGPGKGGSEEAGDPAPPPQSAHTPGGVPSDEEINPSCVSPPGRFLAKRLARRLAPASRGESPIFAARELGDPPESEGDSPIFAPRKLGQSPGSFSAGRLSADPRMAV